MPPLLLTSANSPVTKRTDVYCSADYLVLTGGQTPQQTLYLDGGQVRPGGSRHTEPKQIAVGCLVTLKDQRTELSGVKL